MGHLQDNGFEVVARDVSQERLDQIKAEHGIPGSLAGCHTGEIEGYLIEGHVGAEEIERLLEEKPAVAGLAVPGMPIGSPGMEGPNPERYNVLTFDKQGGTQVYAEK